MLPIFVFNLIVLAINAYFVSYGFVSPASALANFIAAVALAFVSGLLYANSR